MKRHKPDVSRREFIGSVTAAGAAAVVAGWGTRLGAQAPTCLSHEIRRPGDSVSRQQPPDL